MTRRHGAKPPPHVRSGSNSEVRARSLAVRFTLKNRHRQPGLSGPKSANSGPMHQRDLVERFFNKIKQCRRIAASQDKLATDHLAFLKLAAIRIWRRAYESTA